MPRMTKPVLALVLGCLAACASGAQPANEAPAETAEPVATTAPDMDTGPAASASAEAAAPAKPTKAELEQELAPPPGLVDLRPIIGTDPAEALPAIFAGVKKGMTLKDLDAMFPGLGAQPKIAFITFTKQGAKWVRVTGNQKHKEVLDLAFDDAGGVTKIGFMFDPATSKPELWDYLKKATQKKWGKADSDGNLQSWKPAGVKDLSIHKSGATDFSVSVEY
jgi:hypothetical protein